MASEGRIRLIDTTSETMYGCYMTLSHRWGKNEDFKLTEKNELALKESFETSELPRTFRDAVQMVRQLGFDYLWIDSLCIKQDCPKDWEKESYQMQDIYKNSSCNIGATCSKDAYEGLRHSHNPAKIEVSSIKLRIDGEEAPFHAIARDIWDQLSSELLNKRAWVLQERHLSTSMVHFASGQIFWECHEMDACQSFPFGIPIPFHDSTLRARERNPNANVLRRFDRLDKGFDETDPRINSLEAWACSVEDYTGCGITRAEDKLIAISGLAKEFQHSIKARYLAGLWDFHLLPQLLWSLGTLSFDSPLPRPSRYRAPSWSWASIEGKVELATSGILSGHLVEIIEAEVKTLGGDPTGIVTSGYIKIKAALHPIKIPYMEDDLAAQDLTGKTLGIFTILDVLITEEDRAKTYFCMPGQCSYHDCSPETGRPKLQGLILDCLDKEKECYQRIGTFLELEKEKATSAFRPDPKLPRVITIF